MVVMMMMEVILLFSWSLLVGLLQIQRDEHQL